MQAVGCPVWLAPGSPPVFPDPRGADDDGLVAVGGDLAPERLLAAYRVGVFPWYDDVMPPLWWCPDPRTVIEEQNLHVSRSLRRRLRSGQFQFSFNRAFSAVLEHCADRLEGTWLTSDMREAYLRLHNMGRAHSIEAWHGERLVGGLYGVQCGSLFAAESMFHRATDGSKAALVVAVRSLFASGITVFDVQFITDHLQSLGATQLPREAYLARLGAAVDQQVLLSELLLSW